MRTLPRRPFLLGAATAAAALLTACSSDDDAAGSQTEGAGKAVPASTSTSQGLQVDVVLDVRTPEEYAEGHVEGAVHLELGSEDFDARLVELDPGATYAVYCRSGNRSAQAAERMSQAGFTDVHDLGSLDAAATALGREVVTD